MRALASSPIAANASWLYADQFGRIAIVLVVFSFVTRHLGPEQFGILSYAVAFPGLFLPLATIGLDFAVVSEFVRRPSERDRIFCTTFALRALGSVAAFLLCTGVAYLSSADLKTRMMVVITSCSLCFQPLLSIDIYFQSLVAAKRSAIARLVSCVLANVLRLWLVHTNAPLIYFALAFTLEAASYGCCLAIAWKASGLPIPNFKAEYSSVIAREMLKTAWPLFLADVAIALYLKLDQLILNGVAGAEALGKYAAAYRLADATEFFALAIISSYFPTIVRAQQNGGPEFALVIHRFFRRMTAFSVGVALLLALSSPVIANVILGPRFSDVWPIIAVLGVANIFVTQIAVRGKWFLVQGLQKLSLVAFMIGAAVHLSILPFAAARMGAIGAAFSFLAAQIAMALLAPALFPSSRSASLLALRSLIPISNKNK